MKDEANIVQRYADSDVGERIEILIKHYPNFIRLVEGYEQSLSFIIKQEKECNPERQFNCQAIACAIYVGLTRSGQLDEAVKSPEDFLRVVYGGVIPC